MWLLSVLSLALADSSCSKYRCNDGAQALVPNTCVFYLNTTDTFYLEPCDSNSITPYCTPINSPGNSSCIPLPPSDQGKSYPGEPCYTNQTCAYGYCLNSICRANATTSNCTADYDCDFGNFCDLGYEPPICRHQLPLGDQSCTRDEMCVNNGECFYGKCSQVLSYQEGQSISNCDSNNFSLLCSSTQCYNNYCLGFATSAYTIPRQCTYGEECYSNTYNSPPYNLTFFSDCTCGYNSQGNSYCDIFPGDPLYRKYLAKLTEWFNSDAINDCHTLRRTALNCLEAHWDHEDVVEYLYYYYSTFYYAQILENDDCVRQIYGYLYTDTIQEYEDLDDSAAWLGFSLVLVLVICDEISV